MKKYMLPLLLVCSSITKASSHLPFSGPALGAVGVTAIALGVTASDAYGELVGGNSFGLGRLAALGLGIGSIGMFNHSAKQPVPKIMLAATTLVVLSGPYNFSTAPRQIDPYFSIKRVGGIAGAAATLCLCRKVFNEFDIASVALTTAGIVAGRAGAEKLAKRYHAKQQQ